MNKETRYNLYLEELRHISSIMFKEDEVEYQYVHEGQAIEMKVGERKLLILLTYLDDAVDTRLYISDLQAGESEVRAAAYQLFREGLGLLMIDENEKPIVVRL